MAKANLLSHTTQRLSITISTLQTHLHSSLTLHQLHQIHSQMLTSSLINDTFASSLLLRHCCNSHPTPTLTYTRALFDHIKHPNSYIYNTMMKIYNQAHHPKEALSLYTLMLQKSVEIDNYTLPIVIQACSIRISPKEGQEEMRDKRLMKFFTGIWSRGIRCWVGTRRGGP
ncbi:hypothetical protein AMTR_s00032p00129870 [Amborella trichopoda]|uniref:Pentacotripeptide-repeat region of PRORP domain-containing protein n=1 Tax=Amborella trichopoda TaxID=13333 RepID=U5CNV3_AMBTC|nr:hypothetical protein AMTR_s00032p00129870 [Amborella trichopoda]